MRISDWSSDVCSSDLCRIVLPGDHALGEFVVGDLIHVRDQQHVLEKLEVTRRVQPRSHAGREGNVLESVERAELDGGLQVGPIGFGLFPGPFGRASCSERVCLYFSLSVVAVSLKKQHTYTSHTLPQLQ